VIDWSFGRILSPKSRDDKTDNKTAKTTLLILGGVI